MGRGAGSTPGDNNERPRAGRREDPSAGLCAVWRGFRAAQWRGGGTGARQFPPRGGFRGVRRGGEAWGGGPGSTVRDDLKGPRSGVLFQNPAAKEVFGEVGCPEMFGGCPPGTCGAEFRRYPCAGLESGRQCTAKLGRKVIITGQERGAGPGAWVVATLSRGLGPGAG